ncbi:MAG TPA: hypothetical protein VLA98_16020 [Solirubrobacteraceae bacterium]|nr:hypothetical protein [Solirubrobacteraceae bacterium]
MPAHRLLASCAFAAALAVAATPAGTAAAAKRSVVHLRGTAYEFNNVRVLLAGARIRVAELPRLGATVRADGTYDLAVPDRADVTPYIDAAGHHRIYLQTFRTAGENLRNVNFQTPSDPVYRALAALLAVPLDPAGELAQCAIVSTFSTRWVRDLGFRGFIGFGAHGVAGATASARPALPPPVYFNEQVVPDPAQASSSEDGGVIWTGVPAGVYRISARHPRTRFASFRATCEPGRIVNANPPWGLHELAPKSPRLRATWRRRGAAVALRSLHARALPPRAIVRVRCSGRGCPFAPRTIRTTAPALDLRRALGPAPVRLRAGQTLEVGVFAHGYDATVARWAIGGSGTPRRQTLCVPLGNTRPRRAC